MYIDDDDDLNVKSMCLYNIKPVFDNVYTNISSALAWLNIWCKKHPLCNSSYTITTLTLLGMGAIAATNTE